MLKPEHIQKLALGTAQFGLDYGVSNQSGQISQTEARGILELAQTQGINTLDTAVAYGESEEVLGQSGISKFDTITKLPAPPENLGDVRGWVMSELNASLARLQTTSVKALLLHNHRDLAGPKAREIYSALLAAKYSDKVQQIGWSVYSPDDFETLPEAFTPDIVQVPVNILDHRMVNSGWLKKLKDKGVEIHARSAFLQGLLLMPPASRPAYFEQWNAILEIWDRHLGDKSQNALATCLAYSLSIPEVDKVVIGVESKAQLREILSLDIEEYALPKIESDAVPETLVNPKLWKLG